MGNLVVKDNALIEASHKLSEVEQRLILLAILKAREVGDKVEELKDKEFNNIRNSIIDELKNKCKKPNTDSFIELAKYNNFIYNYSTPPYLP